MRKILNIDFELYNSESSRYAMPVLGCMNRVDILGGRLPVMMIDLSIGSVRMIINSDQRLNNKK